MGVTPLPFDSQGLHTLPLGYLAVTGQTVLASNHNPPLEDISSSLSQVLLRSGVAPMIGNLKMNTFRITGLGDGTAATDAATKGQVDSVTPVGSVIDYAGATAPTGWLLCFGQAVSRTTYAALFAVTGTVYGVGDGSTTFNLPDCRGRASAGKDDMGGTAAFRLTTAQGGVAGNTLGASGGAQTQTLTIAQIPSHNHGGTSGSSGAHAHKLAADAQESSPLTANDQIARVGAGGGGDYTLKGSSVGATFGDSSTDGSHTHTITSQGSGEAHPNVQPSIIFNKIIRSGV